MLRAYGHAGYGSTDTKIPRFTTTITNYGSAWTYTTNATEGTKITILQSGIYSLSVGLNGPLNDVGTAGFSLNASAGDRTTDIYVINPTNRLGYGFAGDASSVSTIPNFTCCVPLSSNDVIRPHGNGVAPAGSANLNFLMITKLSDANSGSGQFAGFTEFQVYDSSATWTNSFGVNTIMVDLWGAGGGGMASGSATADSGGGGGGYGKKIFAVTNNQAISFTVGTGGSTGSSPTAGGNTTFLTMTAGGGSAGVQGSPVAGGSVTGADISIIGGTSGYPVTGQPSQGGASPKGGSGGALSTAGTSALLNGVAPGGGGSGGYSAYTGGNGANGRVIIWY